MDSSIAGASVSSELVEALITAAGIAVLYGVKVLAGALKKRSESARQPSAIADTLNRASEVQSVLSRIRAATNASRVYVDRFHNGLEFFPSIPIWHVTRTAEVVSPGVSTESHAMYHTPAELIPELVGAVFGVKASEGVSLLLGESSVSSLKPVYRLDTAKLDNGYLRTTTEQQGTETRVIVPLLDRNRRPVGLLGLDFTINNSMTKTLLANTEDRRRLESELIEWSAQIELLLLNPRMS